MERAAKKDGYLQAKILSQEAASRAYHGKLELYVSEFVITDHATSSAGLKAASRVPKPLPHAAPPSTNLPEFRYRCTRKGSSSGSSRDGISFVNGAGFTPINQRSEPKDGEIQPETTAEPPRQDPNQAEVSTTSSPKIQVEEKDLRA